ncbi:hypothetical protein [Phenylobacterium sp.]|uniref:hypothetical protein n=1 Tax=Phenylobacterium sp. TaxID=1871053 RepID=UPI002736265C|nr:hypothetical protein [Phenylobacterium sp.]MDP3659786.1 hypothetical protein [Phenylobacterium sp.]
MVHRTYLGLGLEAAAVREFDALAPYVTQMLAMRDECAPEGSDYLAMEIALNGLETTAYHFTRRRNFYHVLGEGRPHHGDGNGRLGDLAEAVAAFNALGPYVDRLKAMQFKCRPFGLDYLAIDIAKRSVETAAFHFTRVDAFYAARGDSSGPVGPRL